MTRTSAYGTGSLLRATCPHCHRSISGGRVRDRRGYVIRLRKHKRWTAWERTMRREADIDCPGSGQEVKMDT